MPRLQLGRSFPAIGGWYDPGHLRLDRLDAIGRCGRRNLRLGRRWLVGAEMTPSHANADLDLDALEAALANAKLHGPLEPWDKRGRELRQRPDGPVVGHTGQGDRGLLWMTDRGTQLNYGTPTIETDQLVALAINALPALIQRVRELEAENEEQREDLRGSV